MPSTPITQRSGALGVSTVLEKAVKASDVPSGDQARSLTGPPCGATSCFTWPAEPMTLMPLVAEPLATAIASCFETVGGVALGDTDGAVEDGDAVTVTVGEGGGVEPPQAASPAAQTMIAETARSRMEDKRCVLTDGPPIWTSTSAH